MQTITSEGTTPVTLIAVAAASTIVGQRKYAFMKDFGEKGWFVVIVGNVVDGCGEVLDANGYFKTRAEADAWRIAEIGDGPCVYTDPNLTNG